MSTPHDGGKPRVLQVTRTKFQGMKFVNAVVGGDGSAKPRKSRKKAAPAATSTIESKSALTVSSVASKSASTESKANAASKRTEESESKDPQESPVPLSPPSDTRHLSTFPSHSNAQENTLNANLSTHVHTNVDPNVHPNIDPSVHPNIRHPPPADFVSPTNLHQNLSPAPPNAFSLDPSYPSHVSSYGPSYGPSSGPLLPSPSASSSTSSPSPSRDSGHASAHGSTPSPSTVDPSHSHTLHHTTHNAPLTITPHATETTQPPKPAIKHTTKPPTAKNPKVTRFRVFDPNKPNGKKRPTHTHTEKSPSTSLSQFQSPAPTTPNTTPTPNLVQSTAQHSSRTAHSRDQAALPDKPPSILRMRLPFAQPSPEPPRKEVRPGKRKARAEPGCESPVASAFSPAVGDVEEIDGNECPKLWAPASWKTMHMPGVPDSLLPSIYGYLTVVPTLLFPHERILTYNPIRSRGFVETIVGNRERLDAVTLSSGLVDSIILGERPQAMSFYISRICRLVNHRLSMGPEYMDDVVVECVATMALVSRYLGRFDHWRTHLDGLKRVLEVRGKAGQPMDAYLETKVRRAAVKSAATICSVPVVMAYGPSQGNISDSLPEAEKTLLRDRIMAYLAPANMDPRVVEAIRGLSYFTRAIGVARHHHPSITKTPPRYDPTAFSEEWFAILDQILRYPGPVHDTEADGQPSPCYQPLPTQSSMAGDAASTASTASFASTSSTAAAAAVDISRYRVNGNLPTPAPPVLITTPPERLLESTVRIAAVLFVEELIPDRPRAPRCYHFVFAQLEEHVRSVTAFIRMRRTQTPEQNPLVHDPAILPSGEQLRPIMLWVCAVAYAGCKVILGDKPWAHTEHDDSVYRECVAELVGLDEQELLMGHRHGSRAKEVRAKGVREEEGAEAEKEEEEEEDPLVGYVDRLVGGLSEEYDFGFSYLLDPAEMDDYRMPPGGPRGMVRAMLLEEARKQALMEPAGSTTLPLSVRLAGLRPSRVTDVTSPVPTRLDVEQGAEQGVEPGADQGAEQRGVEQGAEQGGARNFESMNVPLGFADVTPRPADWTSIQPVSSSSVHVQGGASAPGTSTDTVPPSYGPRASHSVQAPQKPQTFPQASGTQASGTLTSGERSEFQNGQLNSEWQTIQQNSDLPNPDFPNLEPPHIHSQSYPSQHYESQHYESHHPPSQDTQFPNIPSHQPLSQLVQDLPPFECSSQHHQGVVPAPLPRFPPSLSNPATDPSSSTLAGQQPASPYSGPPFASHPFLPTSTPLFPPFATTTTIYPTTNVSDLLPQGPSNTAQARPFLPTSSVSTASPASATPSSSTPTDPYEGAPVTADNTSGHHKRRRLFA